VVAWAVLALPTRLILGESAPFQSGVAALICLVPSCLTLVWSRWALSRSPEQQLAAVMGGTATRMFLVLAIGSIVYLLIPSFRETAFWVWLLAFYLFTLTMEMTLLLGPERT